MEFDEIDKNYSSHVELGDGKQVKIEGKGVVAVHTSEGNKKFIHDVHYSPNISQNLLSVGQMMRRGYKLIFDDDKCEIFDKKSRNHVAIVKMTSNNLFPLNLKSYATFRSGTPDDTQLRHLRYGHLNLKVCNF